MAHEKIIDEETKISLKINSCFDENELDNLFSVEEIEKAILELKELRESYEGIHLELRRGLEGEYEKLHGDYEKKIKMMVNWIKEAKKEINKKKVEEREEDAQD